MTTAIVLVAFAISTLLSWRIVPDPARVGCLLPVAAMALTLAALVAVRFSGGHVGSTAPIGIFYGGLLVACGSVPGAVVGFLLRRRSRRPRGSGRC